MSRALIITGATGHQGGAVVDALLERYPSEFLILAVTRNKDSPSARRLAAKSSSIKLVQGDMENTASLFAASKSASGAIPLWGVYSVQVFFAKGASLESEVRQGKAMVDEAIRYNIRHFIYSSVERGGDERSWENRTPVPHFQTKYILEHYLRDSVAKANSTMEWSIVRPGMFMDNLDPPSIFIKIFLTMVRDMMGDTPLQWVAVKDIGIVVAEAFHDFENWKGKSFGVVSESLTFAELSKSFERATGKPVETTWGILGKVMKNGIPGAPSYNIMTEWLTEEGFKADLEKNKAVNPNLTSLETWIKQSSLVRK